MKNKKGIISVLFGNIMEFYGLTLYSGCMAHIISAFFPPMQNSWFLGMFLFCVSFLVRPIGAFFFGRLGDKKGRKSILVFTILGMGLTSLTVALLPSYAMIGISSTIILLCVRVLQGLCVSAEFSGGLVYVMESVEGPKKAFFGSLLSLSSWIGMALAIFFVKFSYLLPSWGWRLGFALDGVATLIALIIRRSVNETPEFVSFKETKKAAALDRKYAAKLLVCVTIVGMTNATSAYILNGFSFLYCVKYLHFNPEVTATLTSLFMPISIIMPAVGGLIAWKTNAFKAFRRFLFIGAISIVCAFVWVGFNPGYMSIGALFTVLSCISGLSGGIAPIIFYKMIPVSHRMTFISLGINISTCIGGGALPLVYTYLIDKSHINYIPGLFAGSIMLISLIIVSFSEKMFVIKRKGV